ncbi:MAG TPA: hypothetical protein VK988_09750 [Acidimicrobiales bacterium]|nr:hypothetical protein [Acidimicrobiales bacterium]
MDVTKNRGGASRERLVKGIHRMWTSYYQSSVDRAVGYLWDNGRFETLTNALPFKIKAIVELADESLVWVTLIVDQYGEEDDNSLRLGVRSVRVEGDDSSNGPLSADSFRTLPFHRLLRLGVMEWSHNSDGSEVTEAQAKALTKRGVRRARRRPEDRHRLVAEAYMEAEERARTVAVARALGKGLNKSGQTAATSAVHRARKAGYLPPRPTSL